LVEILEVSVLYKGN